LQQQQALIVPLAFDLERDGNGIILGQGTKRACFQAIYVAYDIMRKGSNTRILTTATKAGKEYEFECMGSAMQRYIELNAPELVCDFDEANSFSTIGEITQVAHFLARRIEGTDEKPPFERVIFTAKSWHAWRVRMIARRIFKKQGISIPFEVDTHFWKVPLLTRVREIPAYIENWFRIWRMA
jgi:hypothetical protein